MTFFLIIENRLAIVIAKYRIHTDQLSHKNISKTLDYIEEIKNEILIQLDDSLQKKYVNELFFNAKLY